jgi:NitT/TauT family transport system substrate-binding protein
MIIRGLAILSVALTLLTIRPAASAADKLVVGITPSLTATLNVIAEKRGFFKREGLDVELRHFESGYRAVLAMLDNKIDVAESTVFPLVSTSFIRRDFRIFATVAIAGNDNMVIARTDRRIKQVKDLKGKRVGVMKGAFPEYVLDLMLLDAGLGPQDVRIVYDDMQNLPRRVGSGELDAVCLFGGWIDKAKQALEGSFVELHEEDLVRVTTVLSAKSEPLKRHPARFGSLLRSYILAEEYVKENPDGALKTMIDYFQFDGKNARDVWKPNLFHVSLNQSLIKDLENMAGWQVDSGTQKDRKIPDYLNLVRFNILERIDPKRVTIVH